MCPRHSELPADPGRARLIVIGEDDEDRSTVIREVSSAARVERPNGAVVEEIWRQERLPARADDDGTRTGEMEPQPPRAGVSIRRFTLPPDGDRETPTLQASASLYVATVVSGQAHLILDTGPVLLRQGDSIALPGSRHAWRNATSEPAVLVTTVLALDEAS
jgi:quercetin dioxygenase-like cupin family protein